eukprot:maker-scaffold_6-snap-gene-0.53-mRNA-1 protein AED:0.23 eAED:0.25 QI:0/0/0/1/0/0/3/0/392
MKYLPIHFFLLLPNIFSTGINLSTISSAGADGSDKADGTSYNRVRDEDLFSYWSPVEKTGRIGVKWRGNAQTISCVRIIEVPGTEGTIQDWLVEDHDEDYALITGTGVGYFINFDSITLEKVSFYVLSATGIPQVAEFEVYEQQVFNPTSLPTFHPSEEPSERPTFQPSNSPSRTPSSIPTVHPTSNPSFLPTHNPTSKPTYNPTSRPTFFPSFQPSQSPSASPSRSPTDIEQTRSPSSSEEPIQAVDGFFTETDVFFLCLFFLGCATITAFVGITKYLIGSRKRRLRKIILERRTELISRRPDILVGRSPFAGVEYDNSYWPYVSMGDSYNSRQVAEFEVYGHIKETSTTPPTIFIPSFEPTGLPTLQPTLSQSPTYSPNILPWSSTDCRI